MPLSDQELDNRLKYLYDNKDKLSDEDLNSGLKILYNDIHGSPTAVPQKQPSLYSRYRELISPIIGPEEQPAITPRQTTPVSTEESMMVPFAGPIKNYLNRAEEVQGLLPKAFISFLPPKERYIPAKEDSTTKQVLGGLYNLKNALIEGAVSPGGILTAGAGVIPNAVRGLAKAAAIPTIAPLAYESGKKGVESFKQGNISGGIEQLGLGSALGLGLLLGLRGAKGEIPKAKGEEAVLTPKVIEPKQLTEGRVIDVPSEVIKEPIQEQLPAPKEQLLLENKPSMEMPAPPNEIARALISSKEPIVEQQVIPAEERGTVKTDVGGGKLGFAGKSAEEVSIPLKEGIKNPPPGFLNTPIEPLKLEGETYALKPESTISEEYRGIPPRPNLPENIEKIRQEEGGQTGSSGGLQRPGEIIRYYLTSEGKGTGLKDAIRSVELDPSGKEIIGKFFERFKSNAEAKQRLEQLRSDLEESKTQQVSNKSLPTAVEAAYKRIKGLDIKTNPEKYNQGGFLRPDIIRDIAVYGKHIFQTGIRTFKDWGTKLVTEFGPWVKEHLPRVWKYIREIRPIQPLIDRIKSTFPSEVGTKIGDAAENFYSDFSRHTGEFEAAVMEGRKATRLVPNAKARIDQYLQEMNEFGKSSIIPIPKEQIAINAIRKVLHWSRDYQNRIGLLINETREGGFDPNYYPQGMNLAVLDEILNRPISSKSLQYKQDFINYQVDKGVTPEEALRRFNDITASVTGEINKAKHFGPLDESQGYGIPWSWREHNPWANIARYGQRAGRRLSYFENIQKDPVVSTALGVADRESQVSNIPSFAGNDLIQTLNRNMSGLVTPSEIKYKALSRVANSLIMGTKTGVSNLIWSQFEGAKYIVPQQTLGFFVKPWIDIGQSLVDSTRMGVNRLSIYDLHWNLNELEGVQQGLHDASNALNRIQLKNAAERIARANNFAQGKWLAMDNLWQVFKGSRNIQRLQFLNIFAPGWEKYAAKGEFPPEILNEIAAKYVERNQGTYDFRDNPRISIEGPLSYPLALSRYSLGRSNIFLKDVINPLLNGNPYPILMYTGSMLIGATAIKELIQAWTKRKFREADWIELMKAGQDPNVKTGDLADQVTYKALSLADAAQYGGFLTGLAKNLMDIHEGARTRELNIPLLDIYNEMSEHVAEMVDSFLNEKDPSEALDYLHKAAGDTIQAYRDSMGLIYPEERQKIEEKNVNRDVELFKKLYGYPTHVPEFANKAEKEFKQEQDLEKIPEKATNAVHVVIEKYSDKPEELLRQFEKLKNIRLSEIPNPNTSPLQALEFYSWIEKTKGEEYAKQLWIKEAQDRAKRSFKQELVP